MSKSYNKKKVKVTYHHPDGKAGHMFVEFSLLGDIYRALWKHTQVYDILCNGLTYAEHVRQFGGLIVS